MVKASWGTNRTCQSCAARFYDLGKSPIKCPKCGREHDREDFVKVRRAAVRRRVGSSAAAAQQWQQRPPRQPAKKKTDDLRRRRVARRGR